MNLSTVQGRCSVICTTYNHAAYAAESIQSIYDQVYRDIEIIIIDDGSKDDNVAVIRRKLEESPFPAKLLTQANTGNIGLNVNRAIEASSGHYVTFLSLDDLLLSNCVSSKLSLMEVDSDLVVVANTTNLKIDETGRVTSDSDSSPIHGMRLSTAEEILEQEIKHLRTVFVQGMVVRRCVLDAVGHYDTDKIGDDLVIRTKIWRHLRENSGMKFQLLPEPGFVYRKHPGNIHRDTLRQLRAIIEWRDTFFPGRPLPPVFESWTRYFFRHSLRNGHIQRIEEAAASSVEIKELWDRYRKSWKYRRGAIKRGLKRALSFGSQDLNDQPD